MSDQPKLGSVLTADPGRDAVHVAIVPARAAERLTPGARVKLTRRDGALWATWSVNPDGIVDPYLRGDTVLEEGELFYVCLMPGTVTSLRHVWTHPTIPAEEPATPPGPTTAAWAFINNVAKRLGREPSEVVSDATGYLDTGVEVKDGTWAYQDVTDDEWATFWQHHATVTGRAAPRHRTDAPYTCPC